MQVNEYEQRKVSRIREELQYICPHSQIAIGRVCPKFPEHKLHLAMRGGSVGTCILQRKTELRELESFLMGITCVSSSPGRIYHFLLSVHAVTSVMFDSLQPYGP